MRWPHGQFIEFGIAGSIDLGSTARYGHIDQRWVRSKAMLKGA
jgi:hypothetical protein